MQQTKQAYSITSSASVEGVGTVHRPASRRTLGSGFFRTPYFARNALISCKNLENAGSSSKIR